MTDTKDFFLSVTQRLFSNWTALQLAVEHGMGPKERAIEFIPYVTQMMYMNDKPDAQDVAAELEDYMDEYFNTELEDNSALQVANELLRFHRYCAEGNETVATEEFQKLPQLRPWILSREDAMEQRNHRAAADRDSASSNSDDETDKPMDTVDDEWTEVKTRRKK